MSNEEICFLLATELARRIHAKELSTQEVMAAHLEQITRINKEVNAIEASSRCMTTKSSCATTVPINRRASWGA